MHARVSVTHGARTTRLAWSLVCLTLVATCRNKRVPPVEIATDAALATVGPSVHDLAPPDVVFDQPAATMPQLVRATLLEAGQAPRAIRRYHTIVAAERELSVVVRVTTHTYRHGAWIGPTVLPPIRDGFGVSLSPTTDDQFAVVLRGLPGTVEGGDGVAHDDAESYLSRWRALLERRRISVAVDPRGQLGAISFLDDLDQRRTDRTDATDALVERWLGLAVPLPEAAIGVGARWRVVTLLRTGGAFLKQTATYHLAAIAGDQLTVDVELVRVGERQLIAIPGMPADATAELIALLRTVHGEVTLGANSPLPIAGQLQSTLGTHAQFGTSQTAPVDEVSDDQATISIDSR
jgi:hypothetical protein